MKIYIAGKITGVDNYKEIFNEAEARLKKKGFVVMNPAVLPYPGFEHSEYLQICYKMIDVCDAICLLPGWEDSAGANLEFYHASTAGKLIMNYHEEENKFDHEIIGTIKIKATTDVNNFVNVVRENLKRDVRGRR